LFVPGIAAFVRKIAAENRKEMKPTVVVGIDGGRNHRRNGSPRILDMANVGSGKVVDFEVAQRQLRQGVAATREAAMEWEWRD
jgi:hypothetical protein